jgi:hypothetical protein
MTQYLKDLAERTLASFAGGVLSVLGLDVVNVLDMDWKAALGVGAGAAVVSVLKGWVARGVGSPDSAAFLPKG